MTYPPQPYRPPEEATPGRPPVARARRPRSAVIAMAVTLALMLCYGGWVTGAVWLVNRAEQPAEPTPRPTPTGPATGGPTRPPRNVVIAYEVDGRGRADINYIDPAGRAATLVNDAALPWRVELPRQPARLARVTASRSARTNGPLACRVLIDGKEVAHSSNVAAYPSVSCMEVVRPG